ncbi:hypothetical protein M2352_005266 [Azospirillum fermentarium]|uniref:PqqD family protein n=1 Tax=Azospirillum fermentarium TaxID=1233114 RepID=UPI0022272B60|nr:PqqD family protein [Azospirillum fermentarium]MCW2249583.1 hypothetical protein [Azospirillum fermentarium]
MPTPIPAVTPDSLLTRKPDILSTEIDGETVLMSVERGSYYGLATTARDIWLRLEKPMRASDLCRDLAGAYDGDLEQITAETLDFLNRLVNAGLIRAG